MTAFLTLFVHTDTFGMTFPCAANSLSMPGACWQRAPAVAYASRWAEGSWWWLGSESWSKCNELCTQLWEGQICSFILLHLFTFFSGLWNLMTSVIFKHLHPFLVWQVSLCIPWSDDGIMSKVSKEMALAAVSSDSKKLQVRFCYPSAAHPGPRDGIYIWMFQKIFHITVS